MYCLVLFVLLMRYQETNNICSIFLKLFIQILTTVSHAGAIMTTGECHGLSAVLSQKKGRQPNMKILLLNNPNLSTWSIEVSGHDESSTVIQVL